MQSPVEGKSGETRRDFVKKAAYVAPVILTLSATPAHARTGSRYDCDDKQEYSLLSFLQWFH